MTIEDYDEIYAMWQITTKRALDEADSREGIESYLSRNEGMSMVAVDGDEIVGLVGSFVDITDVVQRKNKNDGSQVLYSINDLRKYSYFDRIVDEVSLVEILDPLTGILNRSYSMKFVRSLIAEEIPFSFTIIDLDNFKFVNDNYGHTAGDKVLSEVSKDLAGFTKGFALAGRFGGDELLLIDLKNISQSDKLNFFEKLYGKSNVLRKEVFFENGATFVTGTSGCASFPKDSDNFSDLFSLIDKMLYVGKSMGRNCYKIYDEEKHRYVEIRKIAKNGIFKTMHKLRSEIEKEKTLEGKLKKAMPQLGEILQIKDLYYVSPEGKMSAALDKNFCYDASDLRDIMDEDLISQGSLDLIKKHAPKFYKVLINNGFESVLISKIRKESKIKGYLVCAVDRSLRIWQENECALVYYVAGLLADASEK